MNSAGECMMLSKRHIAIILIAALFLNALGFSCIADTVTSIPHDTGATQLDSLSSEEFNAYIEDTLYCELSDSLDDVEFQIEDISVSYLSKEYLEERAYNVKTNVYFGHTREELDAQFNGTRYVFTLGEDGHTTVKEFEEIEDTTFSQIVRNVAIGAGVIIVCVVVAVVTKNPAAAANAGKTIKMIYAISSNAAKGAATLATSKTIGNGVSTLVREYYQTGNIEEALKNGALAASEGFRSGAIEGAIIGGIAGAVAGYKQTGDIRYFEEGTPQAENYPEGIRFTPFEGKDYPRFEKYAKRKLKFQYPSLDGPNFGKQLTGIQSKDTRLANAMCGYKTTPPGYVWHHVEDMQTMLLIPIDVHSMWHNGGASLIRQYLGN